MPLTKVWKSFYVSIHKGFFHHIYCVFSWYMILYRLNMIWKSLVTMLSFESTSFIIFVLKKNSLNLIKIYNHVYFVYTYILATWFIEITKHTQYIKKRKRKGKNETRSRNPQMDNFLNFVCAQNFLKIESFVFVWLMKIRWTPNEPVKHFQVPALSFLRMPTWWWWKKQKRQQFELELICVVNKLVKYFWNPPVSAVVTKARSYFFSQCTICALILFKWIIVIDIKAFLWF